MDLHLVRLQDCPAQPWRNGGGLTRELLAWPQGQAWQQRGDRADRPERQERSDRPDGDARRDGQRSGPGRVTDRDSSR